MNAVTIDTKTINLILDRLEKLARDVKTIKARLTEKEPPYGSNQWWEWSDKKALGDIKAGRYTAINNKQELQVFLDNLKKS